MAGDIPYRWHECLIAAVAAGVLTFFVVGDGRHHSERVDYVRAPKGESQLSSLPSE